MAKFRVGDRVYCDNVGSDAYGYKGRVAKIDNEYGDDAYLVKFDHFKGHSGGYCDSNNYWWVDEGDIRIIPKVKAGDKVKILDGKHVKDYYGSWVESGMSECIGRIYEVEEVTGDCVGVIGSDWAFDVCAVEVCPRKAKTTCEGENVRIYRIGDSVIAELLECDRRAVAKCHPDDEFDFATGAKLALTRLFEKPVETPKPLNCKFVVARSKNHSMRVGKIYEVVNGRFKDSDKISEFPLGEELLTSFDELKAYLGDGSVECSCGYYNRSSKIEIIQIVE